MASDNFDALIVSTVTMKFRLSSSEFLVQSCNVDTTMIERHLIFNGADIGYAR